MKLTVYQRRLLEKLRDPAVKLEQGTGYASPGSPPVFYLCRWDGYANALVSQPARRTVEPLIAGGYLRRVRRRRPWLMVWWELSRAGEQALAEAPGGPVAPADDRPVL